MKNRDNITAYVDDVNGPDEPDDLWQNYADSVD